MHQRKVVLNNWRYPTSILFPPLKHYYEKKFPLRKKNTNKYGFCFLQIHILLVQLYQEE